MADIEFLKQAGVKCEPEMNSIVLVGGKGTRLKEERKVIDVKKHVGVNACFHDEIGPKGLALLQPQGKEVKPLTDWHLEIHDRCSQISEVTLALGCGADIMESYYSGRYKMNYKSLVINLLPEKNPAGTLAPLIKLFTQGKLTDGVYVYANGDNLADIDFLDCYIRGMSSAVNSGMDTKSLVIDIAALVPWEESSAYGTLDMNFSTGRVNSFKEKGPIEENSYIDIDGKKLSPINSGFSIIVNPLSLFNEFLSDEVIQVSQSLEEGALDYKKNEKIVKYETFYELLASQNKMVGVLHEGYWTDLGTEEKLVAAESSLPAFITSPLS